MIGLLKRQVFMVVAASLAWSGWRAAEEPAAGEKTGDPIALAAFELPDPRDAEAQPRELPDPFRLSQLLARLAELERFDAGLDATADAPGDDESAPSTTLAIAAAAGSARLRLDSTLATGFSTSAVINGRTYRVGDAIQGLDEDAPPILAAVDGRSVAIHYRGQSYVLDLAVRREMDLSPRFGPTEEEPR